MVYTFARVERRFRCGLRTSICKGRRSWVRLHEKGGKEHEMPTHRNQDTYLEECIAAAGIGSDRKGPLFRSARVRSSELTENLMLQSDV